MKIPKKYAILLIIILTVILLIGSVLAVFLAIKSIPFGFARDVSNEEAALRLQVVETAQNWLGCKESDNSYQPIIDI